MKPMTAGPKVAAPIGEAVAKMTGGLFSAADWQCPSYVLAGDDVMQWSCEAGGDDDDVIVGVRTSIGLHARHVTFATPPKSLKSCIDQGPFPLAPFRSTLAALVVVTV